MQQYKLMFPIEGRMCTRNESKPDHVFSSRHEASETCFIQSRFTTLLVLPLDQRRPTHTCVSASAMVIYEETFHPPLFPSVPCPTAVAVAGVPSADLILDPQSLTSTHWGDTSVNSDRRPVHQLRGGGSPARGKESLKTTHTPRHTTIIL